MERNNDNILNLLHKENESLKKIIKEKNITNETLQSLLIVLDMQRERINFLEEDNTRLQKTNDEALNKLKDLQLKINSKYFISDKYPPYIESNENFYKNKCLELEKELRCIKNESINTKLSYPDTDLIHTNETFNKKSLTPLKKITKYR